MSSEAPGLPQKKWRISAKSLKGNPSVHKEGDNVQPVQLDVRQVEKCP